LKRFVGFCRDYKLDCSKTWKLAISNCLLTHIVTSAQEKARDEPGLKISGIPISTGYQISILDTRYHRLGILKKLECWPK
jgi:hypothetical protein